MGRVGVRAFIMNCFDRETGEDGSSMEQTERFIAGIGRNKNVPVREEGQKSMSKRENLVIELRCNGIKIHYLHAHNRQLIVPE
jgi:hypothetical protein